ncbi:hypothetical protein CC85DRAFT_29408 [Cutaneotrichosporon oleaginosum]|uniref:Stress response protein NST1 n=1 Tax=Cutaneotrichosporon oleaginosum TaxID=879819 RepID=A0A0J1B8F1_9TREE|nr:uncharacterized protein CC85DRAFT_29408 [Cutaneotrichosporon oleaginosum]KLT44049.1 hypothetical protein CC85DRAFT_29408 [Cutaneotrichosporon oleaginosum]
MSSQAPAASADPPALSKSAKKKAKKAAKAAKQQSFDSAALAAVDDELHSSAQFAEGRPALNPAADFSAAALEPYYEDAVAKLGIDPAAAAVANAAASAARTRGLPPDPLTFASYAFDHPLGPPPGDNPFDTGFSPSVGIGHDELLETANELFRRMHYDSYGDDDPYWSTLPTHVRQFIREAIPFNGQSNPSNDPHATQKDLYAMAQRIVQAASHGIGFQAVNPMNGRAHMPSSIAEDLGFHNHPNHPDAPAREDEYDEEDDFDEEPESGLVQPNGEAPKKKNKKKKKKATQPVEPPPATLPPPAVKQPPRQPVPPQPQPLLPQPQLHPPPPPVASAPSAQPAPSSRAAGKQPMTHAPVAAANPPARSVRAAGKAPVTATPHTHHNHTHPPPPKLGNKGKAAAPAQPAKIWTAASPEEREAITQFWLALSDAERRDLLQLEKESVLKRMKEQQRHSCGCAVCGRKKVNIEMELEQLYHGYYADLEQYTSHQRAAMASQDCPPPPGAGPFPGSVEIDPSGQLLKLDHLAPNSSHHPSVDESDEDYEDDDYEDEEEIDEDDLASEEADTDYARKPKAHASRPEGSDDFFGFGKNLATIKGIITVADDMLKNDGAKFLEMMEQLAVKRVAREELNARELQEETDEDDEEDDISESQRMEDGRRMFAIFAARMFETRVLTAYRERVAKEREEQLLRELEAEEEGQRAKQEKKAKEAQRKRDKKKAQKQRQDDERAAREAAAAEEARAAEAKAAEDAKERQRRQEEERARREAAKRAAQEEAARKEAERRKRQEEERAREEEAARKKREREEKIKKEREAREREAKEKERREREEKERLSKEKAEKERIAREAREKAEKERQAKLEEEPRTTLCRVNPSRSLSALLLPDQLAHGLQACLKPLQRPPPLRLAPGLLTARSGADDGRPPSPTRCWVPLPSAATRLCQTRAAPRRRGTNRWLAPSEEQRSVVVGGRSLLLATLLGGQVPPIGLQPTARLPWLVSRPAWVTWPSVARRLLVRLAVRVCSVPPARCGRPTSHPARPRLASAACLLPNTSRWVTTSAEGPTHLAPRPGSRSTVRVCSVQVASSVQAASAERAFDPDAFLHVTNCAALSCALLHTRVQ